ncbi:MAG: Dual-specificity RNA methyltransferase RlmN [Alphaproteobacteria bacterium MarineAlpha3_Bin5]|nr:23S rRNA (adenine(2503)-C(2))-methyltransferase RlmN [Magnetovibrio sp.]PPR79374.1 MAG: Dual-specificity RNA methyltransferase RlmN [Alphaproteobacteria bacterium MarineAlpha3_Bin5]|tara:strand:- start:24 stop:1124 length:1101 start_codon:yes stop_codon:yes gene_type:complete
MSKKTEIDHRVDLVGLDRDELLRKLIAIDEKPFRVKQLWHWMYFQGRKDFSEMTSLAKMSRTNLNNLFKIRRPEVVLNKISSDLARKWLLRYEDGNEVEMVYIPETDRGALCVSSQVGCTLSCSFCHTGTQNIVRNLSASEIVNQFMLARDHYDEWPTPKDGKRKISNIVLMGMGEPLFNYDNVAKALKIVMDAEGIALSRRRITLSTSGVVPKIKKCGTELGVNLAISLHAVTDDLRDQLVPINKKWPIAELLRACKDYPAANNARRITFEYVMLKGINDSVTDARELVRLIKGIPAKVNLIPFNPWPGAPFDGSSRKTINQFASIVNKAGYSSPVRNPRGRDILAACGQLKSSSKKSLNTRSKS